MGSRTIHLQVTDASNYNPSFMSYVNLAKSSSMSDPVSPAAATNTEDAGVECSVRSSCCNISVQDCKCVLKIMRERRAQFAQSQRQLSSNMDHVLKWLSTEIDFQSRGINILRRYPSLKLLEMMPLHAKLHQACGPGLRAACFNTVSTSRYTALVASQPQR